MVLAFIGRNPLDDDNVYIATGDSGQGMTHGTIAGILLTDLIQGRRMPGKISTVLREYRLSRCLSMHPRISMSPDSTLTT